jgi:hypothetical protein
MAKRLQQRIDRIKQKIVALGPVHPGRITQQYNVCGTPGCRCKDPKNPRKHGPYHYLSYSFQRKSTTVFVPQECLAEMQECTERYARLKELWNELVAANVELARQDVLGRKRSK